MNILQKKHSIKKTTLWIIGILFILLSTGGLFLYNNFNWLLSDALMRNFNSSQISDVYELSFNKLNVNILLGNIVVKDVEIKPR